MSIHRIFHSFTVTRARKHTKRAVVLALAAGVTGVGTADAHASTTPALGTSDTIALGSQHTGDQYRLSFDSAVKDPVLHLTSVASELDSPPAPPSPHSTGP